MSLDGTVVPRLALAGAALFGVPVKGLVQSIGVSLRGAPVRPMLAS